MKKSTMHVRWNLILIFQERFFEKLKLMKNEEVLFFPLILDLDVLDYTEIFEFIVTGT